MWALQLQSSLTMSSRPRATFFILQQPNLVLKRWVSDWNASYFQHSRKLMVRPFHLGNSHCFDIEGRIPITRKTKASWVTFRHEFAELISHCVPWGSSLNISIWLLAPSAYELPIWQVTNLLFPHAIMTLHIPNLPLFTSRSFFFFQWPSLQPFGTAQS